MARKPGRMYRYPRGQVTTRKEYLGGIPAIRIAQYDLGNKTQDFPLQLSLTSNEHCQIRHNALESARISANRVLEKQVGPTNFRLRIRAVSYTHLRAHET